MLQDTKDSRYGPLGKTGRPSAMLIHGAPAAEAACPSNVGGGPRQPKFAERMHAMDFLTFGG